LGAKTIHKSGRKCSDTEAHIGESPRGVGRVERTRARGLEENT